MKQQLATMLELQADMNTKVHEQWRDQNFEWYRAIWVECAELLDHYGWKWWKKQTPDVDQIALELVDIWHFGLSLLLLSGDTVETISERVIAGFDGQRGGDNFALDLEQFTAQTLVTKEFDISGFRSPDGRDRYGLRDPLCGLCGQKCTEFFPPGPWLSGWKLSQAVGW